MRSEFVHLFDQHAVWKSRLHKSVTCKEVTMYSTHSASACSLSLFCSAASKSAASFVRSCGAQINQPNHVYGKIDDALLTDSTQIMPFVLKYSIPRFNGIVLRSIRLRW